MPLHPLPQNEAVVSSVEHEPICSKTFLPPIQQTWQNQEFYHCQACHHTRSAADHYTEPYLEAVAQA